MFALFWGITHLHPNQAMFIIASKYTLEIVRDHRVLQFKKTKNGGGGQATPPELERIGGVKPPSPNRAEPPNTKCIV